MSSLGSSNKNNNNNSSNNSNNSNDNSSTGNTVILVIKNRKVRGCPALMVSEVAISLGLQQQACHFHAATNTWVAVKELKLSYHNGFRV